MVDARFGGQAVLRRRLAFISASDGTRLCYELIGSAPQTLVLCDGVGCAGYIWKHFVAAFADSFRILHSHYRGHGHSQVPQDLASMKVEQFTDDVLRLLSVIPSDEPVILIGHSMGVQVVLEFYRRYPEKVRALVLINGAAGNALRYVHGTPLFAAALPPLRKILGRWSGPAKKYWKPLLDSELSYLIGLALEVNPKLTKRDDFRPYFRQIAGIDPEVFFTALSSVEQHSADDVLERIKVPVLVVASEKDRFTPFPLMQKMFERIPGAEFLSLPQASHIGPLERPELLHEGFSRFVARVLHQKS